MLEPDNRDVLLDLLRPPADMELDVAVATTFTLDLAAALVAPLAFASFASDGPGDPIAALESVRSSASRFTVFCQAGEIHVPRAASDLFAFLEPIVHEVRRPRPGRLFHPKLWLLRYRGDEREALRLLVPTRNLTNDASWDAVLRLDGEASGGPGAANRPLADLLRWCLSNSVRPIDAERAAAIESLTESVRRAWWDLPEGANDVVFHTLGVTRGQLPDFSGRRTLVISPFVNSAGIEYVAPSDGTEVILVSRPEQMELLDPSTLEWLDCRWVASVDLDQDEAVESPLGDLHAKLVVVERAKQAHLFVGSANATDAAFAGNVEILVELVGGPKALGVEVVLNGMSRVLQVCEPIGGGELPEADQLRKQLADALREAAVADLTVEVGPDGAGAYSLLTTSVHPLLPTDFAGTASVELLTRPGFGSPVEPGARLSAEFVDVTLADITPFVVVRVEITGSNTTVSEAAVVRARLVGDPADRLDAVIARQVDTPAKFLKFLFLLLGLSGLGLPPWWQPSDDGAPGDFAGAQRLIDLGVFEALTRALATNPSGINDLSRLVDRLRATPEGSAKLPDGFNELWDAVVAARSLLAGARL